MARPTKAHTFTIYEDAGIPTPDLTYQPSFDDAVKAQEASVSEKECEDGEEEQSPISDNEDEQNERDLLIGEYLEDGNEANNGRRESAFTTTSVSSFPISAYNTDDEHDVPQRQQQTPYTPPIIRPSFRRPESVRRMQMASPPPFGSRSPRQSILRHSRSRTWTPRCVDSRGSARSAKRTAREVGEQEQESKQYPLVLLHVTLLPIDLPWSMESMQELLPSHTLENLQLLRSKVSDTVLRRGILISHPREEYELLEERLLEALELKSERVTKCGHFRSRSSSSTTSEDPDSDSALGSSLDSSDGEVCTTCQNYIKISKSGVGTGKSKWTVKVFAANGLMRSSAWAAAWAEMERVDVEIAPWIGEELRRRLDGRREEEEVEKREKREEECERLRVRVACEERNRAEDAKRRGRDEKESDSRQPLADNDAVAMIRFRAQVPTETREPSVPTTSEDLPRIYRRSQVPLSVLLKNYVYLLAQDRRNVAIFFLGIVALFFALKPAPVSGKALSSPAREDSGRCQPTVALPSVMPNQTGHVLGGKGPATNISAQERVAEALVTPAEEDIEPALLDADEYVLATPEPSNDGEATYPDVESDTANDESELISRY